MGEPQASLLDGLLMFISWKSEHHMDNWGSMTLESSILPENREWGCWI